jgi:hypothetical protein
MKLIAALVIAVTGVTGFSATIDDPAPLQPTEHEHPQTPIPADTTLVADFGTTVTPAQAAILRPDLFVAPELAKACYISPSTGAYVKATCQAYSGSGSRGFQVIGYAWNGCNRYIKIYGSIGSAPTRSSYIPSSGAGTFLPFPWRIVTSWIVKW